jgi:hypothetical protein
MNGERALPVFRLGALALMGSLLGMGQAQAQLVILEEAPARAAPAPAKVQHVPDARLIVDVDAAPIKPRINTAQKDDLSGVVVAESAPPASRPVPRPTPMAAAVRHLGRPATARAASAPGWGRQIPLSIAVAQIVPSDWSVVYVGAGDAQASVQGSLVTWQGGSDWTAVLDNALRTPAASQPYVTLDWPEKKVWIGQPGSAAPVPPAPVKVWTLLPTLSLRENIEAWSKKAGWTVVWEAVDYAVVAKVEFRGEFDSPEGPLAELIRAYEKSDQPIQVRLKTLDRVLHVVNKNYRPVQVEPSSPYDLAPGAFPDAPRPTPPAPPLATQGG